MLTDQEIQDQIALLSNDLTSGAAEIALRAITVFQSASLGTEHLSPAQFQHRLAQIAKLLIDAQPAMSPLFHLANRVLVACEGQSNVPSMQEALRNELSNFETMLCESAAKIADRTKPLIPPGSLIFAYSFSSTVASCLLSARASGKFFRVVCTESRPSFEGRKMAKMLADGGIEVMSTFDSAMGLIVPNCSAAFMGCDGIGRPGIVNKVGSWLLALACREVGIPLYVLTGTEKFTNDERIFAFENHQRPGEEVWADAPKGVKVLNRQFELIPFSLVTGIVTENGIFQEKDVDQYISNLTAHEQLSKQTI
jgi:translation initiation factor 2B subunit (eIF-2B alpha/beta/delta family)